jgi:hypothetical protein
MNQWGVTGNTIVANNLKVNAANINDLTVNTINGITVGSDGFEIDNGTNSFNIRVIRGTLPANPEPNTLYIQY